MPQALSTPPSDMPQDVIDFRTRTIMPDTYVDQIWERRPGYLEAVIAGVYSTIRARLRKRYPAWFAEKPEAVVRWMTLIVTPDAYRARGIDGADEQITLIDADRIRALEELKEAADGENGLFDLPVSDVTDVSAVARGGPLGSSEASPYSWMDVQAEALRGGSR